MTKFCEILSRYSTLYCIYGKHLILTQLFIRFKLSSEKVTNLLSNLKRSFTPVLIYVDLLGCVASCEARGNAVRPVSWETVSLKQSFYRFLFLKISFCQKVRTGEILKRRKSVGQNRKNILMDLPRLMLGSMLPKNS